MMSAVDLKPSLEEIVAAQERLTSIAFRTPLLEYSELNQRIGGRLLIKAETFQRSGSFKFRGAYNRLIQLSPTERRRGVVAYSSGNHAIAVAMAAAMVGAGGTVVMPDDAPRIKINKVRQLGAEIIFYDRVSGQREDVARKIANEAGAILVPSFDDPHVIAGQATVGLEALDQLAQLDVSADALLVSCGGGGLVSGCALAVAHRRARTKVYAVEPLGFDRVAQSLATGAPVSIRPQGRSVCDALMARAPGQLTFAILRALLAGSFVVSDADVASAMLTSFVDLKLVLEPGGAAALAAVLSGTFDGRGKTTLVICSGGNVDAGTFVDLLGVAHGTATSRRAHPTAERGTEQSNPFIAEIVG
jgi:threonine dehydratase